MKLTHDQISYIDNLLEEKGVKFWDVRLEMTDHIVTQIENYSIRNINFEKAVQDCMTSIGDNEGFDQSMKSKQREIQKRFSERNLNELIAFFTNWQTIIPFLIIISLAIALRNHRYVLILLIVITHTPSLAQYIFGIYHYHKVYKSIYVLSSTAANSRGISLLSLFIIFPKAINEHGYQTPNWYLVLYLILAIPILYCSLKVFIDAFKTYNYPLKKA